MLRKVANICESVAPLNLAASWDNVGVLVEAPYPKQTEKIMLTVDLTPPVLEEALEKEVSVIVSYHPTLFNSFKSLRLTDEKQNIALKLAANGISLYSPHTALDPNIREWLHSCFSYKVEDDIGIFEESKSLEYCVTEIKKFLGLQFVRVAKGYKNHKIKTVAVCAGSGSSMPQADLVWAGEMSHHDVLSRLPYSHVVLCEHTNTERGYLKIFQKNFFEFETFLSQMDKDPLEIN